MSQKQPIERGYKPINEGYRPSQGDKVTNGFQPSKNIISTPPPPPPPKKG